jgi:nucleoside diphosphate kinase
MSEQTTLVFIKPEAMKHWRSILEELKIFGDVVWRRSVTLNSDVIGKLYPRMHPTIARQTMEHLCGQQVPVFVLQGENVVNRILHFAGTQTHPYFCDHSSLRHRYGIHHGKSLPGGKTYYFNAVHRSGTVEEAKAEILLLMDSSLMSFPL